MKRIASAVVAVAMAAGFLASMPGTVVRSDEQASPLYGVTIPPGYREWQLIAVDNLLVAGKVNQLRAQLGNDIAIKAFKEGKLPFPVARIRARRGEGVFVRPPSAPELRVMRRTWCRAPATGTVA